MKQPSDFAICISNYLTKHLVGARNLSPNTIKSYRDTFCLLLIFMKEMNKKIDRICLADIDASLVSSFLDWLETEPWKQRFHEKYTLGRNPCVFSVCTISKSRNAVAVPAHSGNSDERNRKRDSWNTCRSMY